MHEGGVDRVIQTNTAARGPVCMVVTLFFGGRRKKTVNATFLVDTYFGRSKYKSVARCLFWHHIRNSISPRSILHSNQHPNFEPLEYILYNGSCSFGNHLKLLELNSDLTPIFPPSDLYRHDCWPGRAVQCWRTRR